MKDNAGTILSACTATIMVATAISACCSESKGIEGRESVEQMSAPLAAYNLHAWKKWSMPINVCFRKYVPDPQKPIEQELPMVPDDATYGGLKALTLSTLQASWGKVPGMSFADAGECADSSTQLHLVLKKGCGFGGWCGSGVGTTCELGGDLGTRNGFDCAGYFQTVAVHEVGHALGAGHEHSRTDSDPRCSPQQVDACLNCKAKAEAHMACTADEWNLCDDWRVCTPTDWSPCDGGAMVAAQAPVLVNPVDGDKLYERLKAQLGNNGPISDFALLT